MKHIFKGGAVAKSSSTNSVVTLRCPSVYTQCRIGEVRPINGVIDLKLVDVSYRVANFIYKTSLNMRNNKKNNESENPSKEDIYEILKKELTEIKVFQIEKQANFGFKIKMCPISADIAPKGKELSGSCQNSILRWHR
ncbi:hypothetical protein ACTXT7_015020 [Hymenolepis weldensis]